MLYICVMSSLCFAIYFFARLSNLPSLPPSRPAPACEPGSTINANANNYAVGDEYDAATGLWPEYCNPSYRMPDEIEVKVKLAAGDYYFPVIIVKNSIPKAYLGGYRNKATGAIYHHSTTQTPTEAKKASRDVSKLRCRETQTYVVRTLSVQPYRESGTQMARQDLLLDTSADYSLEPRRYFTAEQLLNKKRFTCVLLQRCWRGYRARCEAHRLRASNAAYEEKQRADAAQAIKKLKEKQDADMHRRLHPSSNDDFAVLYNELDTWRKAEIIKIKANIPAGEARNEAMHALLMDETKALQNIQKLKTVARKSSYVQNTTSMLSNMAKPYQWQLSSGETALVQTPATQRAKELLDLYNALATTGKNTSITSTNGSGGSAIDDRLDCLLHIKWTVLEFDSALTKDIADLTDREADLLNRGRPVKSMEKLRGRLSNLFLEFLEDPLYNPRAADFVGKKNRNE